VFFFWFFLKDQRLGASFHPPLCFVFSSPSSDPSFPFSPPKARPATSGATHERHTRPPPHRVRHPLPLPASPLFHPVTSSSLPPSVLNASSSVELIVQLPTQVSCLAPVFVGYFSLPLPSFPFFLPQSCCSFRPLPTLRTQSCLLSLIKVSHHSTPNNQLSFFPQTFRHHPSAVNGLHKR